MSSLRDAAIALLLAIVAFLVFNANGRLISAADTYAARYLPFSMVRHGSVVLDPVASEVALGRTPPGAQGEPGTAFWIMKGRGEHLVSKYPLVVPLVVAPLYLPAVHYLESIAWGPHIFDKVARAMEKLCASLIAAISVAWLYLLLRRRSGPRTAIVLSLVFAFGTTTWVISSQALWMHGLAQLLVIATLWLVTGPGTPLRVALAGFLCALIAANRPPDAILAAALGLCGLWWAGRRWPWFVLAGAVPVALTLAYNLGTVGHVAGAYALAVHPTDFNDNLLEGVAGLLVSPTRGLFVFSPFLLFVPCLLLLALRERSTRALTLALCAAMAVQIVGYANVDWRQGIAWGPRWLTDMVPLLVWMLPPIVAALSRGGRALFGAACVVSIGIQAVGAFWYTGATDTAVLTAKADDRMQPMWDWRNAAFIAELKHPRAPADLFMDLQGNVDLIDTVDVAVRDAAAGDLMERQLDVAGWTLVDSSSPRDIALLIDGREVAGTSQFFERPDVARTLGETSPAGWRLRVPVGGLAPGRHVLAVLVRAHAGGEVRLLRERAFELKADDAADPAERFLRYASRQAVERIASGQQAQGYWLTSFTGEPRFEKPQPEMNTYLNAIMLDVAGPVADAARMQGMLARARGFLRSQIEAGGLVRYHGRPDAPTIGVLGCAITPDSDDTALVWRVAPGEDSAQLETALGVMRKFRTGDGLYRTWLAKRDDYQCLDPGADPNPADIGIQMHIYMLLAERDPSGARSLCEALMRKADDSSLWVYYAGAPPMAILRQADLHRAGCPLQLPASRLQPAAPGQEVWARAAALVQQIDGAPQSAAVKTEATRLLRELAANDFSALAGNPPLLYHNDMSATVRRYYWSQDVGYALWLRLYHGTRGATPAQPSRASAEGAVQ
ncbi:hypothetical protein RT97_31040 [Variovorax paradoxus]|uniref:Glycosyltransferase RgtA/B/C/D-like domain-containing protein n=1 Tax=Variovorax paradoxus TaxID=34073 RepID=A0A0D0LFH8_VARPD|nr:hypothetical protein [Variovorax paradoxus]KIQ16300.1 hypothetical protein RT97_31040 [Variovorax paradoxus]